KRELMTVIPCKIDYNDVRIAGLQGYQLVQGFVCRAVVDENDLIIAKSRLPAHLVESLVARVDAIPLIVAGHHDAKCGFGHWPDGAYVRVTYGKRPAVCRINDRGAAPDRQNSRPNILFIG